MKAWLSSVKNWISAQGGLYHVAAAAIVFLTIGYGAVPSFHSLCITIWGATPPFLRQVFVAVAGLYTLYTASNSAVKVNFMKAKVVESQKNVDIAHAEIADARATISKVLAIPVSPKKV